MSTRLFHTIVVVGATLGAGAGVVSITSGCDVFIESGHTGPHGIIDASNDDWHDPIADAPIRDGGTDAVFDAPDAAIDADGVPDAPPDGAGA
jgi:hypothetical protein